MPVLVVSGLLACLGLGGAWTAVRAVERARWLAVCSAAVGLAVAAAGRRHGVPSLDALSWLLVGLGLAVAWGASRSAARPLGGRAGSLVPATGVATPIEEVLADGPRSELLPPLVDPGSRAE